ncbi:MAG: DUF222 domain-containing protein [Candidatus Nanopelagicales bacterium]
MSLEISHNAHRRARIRESLPTEHPKLLDQIGELTVDQLPDPTELSLEELAGSIGVAGRLVNQLEAWLTTVAAEADTRKASQVLCAGTTGTMVAAALNTTPSVGSGMVATGRALRDLPAVAEAYRAGAIGTRQVLALQHAAPRIEDFPSNEPWLVEIASQVDSHELRRLLDVLITQSIPEGADLDHLAQREKRGVSLNERQDGMWKLDGLLDAITGNKLNDLLQPLMAKEGADDPRGPKQRRADALDDVISLARANRSPLGVSGLTVLVDIDGLPDGFQAALEDGNVLGPDTFDLLSCSRGDVGDLRDQPAEGFRTTTVGPHRPAGQQRPVDGAESPRQGLRAVRETTPIYRSPPHHPLERRRFDRPAKSGPAVRPLPPRPAPRLLQRDHGRRRHPDPHPRPRTTRQTHGLNAHSRMVYGCKCGRLLS